MPAERAQAGLEGVPDPSGLFLADRRAGTIPFCVAASTGTVGTGAIAGLEMALWDILGKRAFLTEHYSWLRTALMREPRGHKNMFGVFLTPPSSADYDAGMIWMDSTRFHDMCGHGTIALGMAMVSHGLVRQTGALTKIRFETTCGPVTAEVTAGVFSA